VPIRNGRGARDIAPGACKNARRFSRERVIIPCGELLGVQAPLPPTPKKNRLTWWIDLTGVRSGRSREPAFPRRALAQVVRALARRRLNPDPPPPPVSPAPER
jgi:hypothetical protein